MRVASERAEEDRAVLLELVPEGFEEVLRDGELELVAYVEPDLERTLRAAFARVDGADVPDGWADAWRRFHRPVRIGALWVGPPWEPIPADALPVVIDPGRAFGTGAHPTTRLCLELLIGEQPGRLLDLGCGSGVLAIAAARLGFAPVMALDLDEHAVSAARANAEANGVEVDVRVGEVLADALPDADLALANLERDLVERMSARPLPPRLVVSGFLASDRLDFAGWRRAERRELDGWAAEALTRC